MIKRPHYGHVLGVAAFLTPLLGAMAPLALAPLLVLTALAALAVGRLKHARWPSPPKRLVALMVAFFAWALTSTIWTIDPDDALLKLLQFIGIVLCGMTLMDAAGAMNADERRFFEQLLVAGLTITILVLLIERMLDTPIKRLYFRDKDLKGTGVLEQISASHGIASFNQGVTVIALTIWPTLLVLSRLSRSAAYLFLIAASVLIYTFSSNAAFLALVVGMVTYTATWYSPRKSPVIIAALLAAYVLASPIIHRVVADKETIQTHRSSMPQSGFHRLLIWNFSAHKSLERPLLGWGMRSSRHVPGGDVWIHGMGETLPLHPHNAALQIWLELGAVGAMLGAGLFVFALATVRNNGVRTEAAMGAAVITSAAVILFLSFGLWQSWWISALWLGVAFATAAQRGGGMTPPLIPNPASRPDQTGPS